MKHVLLYMIRDVAYFLEKNLKPIVFGKNFDVFVIEGIVFRNF